MSENKISKNFSDGKGNSFACVLLSGKSSYASWEYTVSDLLKATKQDHLVFEKPIKAEDVSTEDHETALRHAKCVLQSTLSQQEIDKILHCTTANEIWLHFKNAYGKKTGNEKLELMSDLNALICNSAAEVSGTVTKALAIRGKLKNLGVVLDDTMLISALIKTLPEDFGSFLEAWTMQDAEWQTLERFIDRVQERAKKLADTQNNMALIAHQSSGLSRGNNKTFVPLPQRRANYAVPAHHRHQGVYTQNQMRTNTGQNNYYFPRQAVASRYMEPNVYQQMVRPGNSTTIPPNVCSYCRKPGHWKADCHKLERQNQTRGFYDTSYSAPGFALENRETHEKQTNDIVMMAINSTSAINYPNKLSKSMWIVDSGCSHHMSPYSGIMTDYTCCSEPIEIRIGDNSVLKAVGYGKVNTNLCTLSRVYHVPHLASNLFSVSSAIDKHIEFNIKADRIDLSKNGNLIGTATRQGGTYVLRLEVLIRDEYALTATTLEKWHQRLAHLPRNLVIKMANQKVVEGLNIVASEDQCCIDCRLNKCRRASHPTRSTPKASTAGQHLHFDIIGPIKPEGLGGQKFILNGKDEFSSMRMIVCLKAKSQCPESVKLMISKAEIQTGNSVLEITTDNGTEFTSERLNIFLQHKGILHTYSAPYVPQQNGTIENDNRTLLNQARTVINAAQMPQILWPEAINAVTYTSNRCISTKQDNTPYELWYKSKPNLSNIKIFGEQAAVFTQDHQRAKFEPKATLMNFVGYTDNRQTFLFYDPRTNKIHTTCDASFINQVGLVKALNNTEEVSTEMSQVDLVQFDFGKEPDSTDTPADTASNLDATGGGTDDNVLDFSTPNTSIQQPEEDEMGSSTPVQSDYEGEKENIAVSKVIGPTESQAEAAPLDQSNVMMRNVSPSIEQELSPDPETQTNQAGVSLRQTRQKERVDYKALATGRDDLRDIGSDVHRANVALAPSTPPTTYFEAISRTDAKGWLEAIDRELESLKANDVFDLVDPPGRNVIGSRWVFSMKTMPNGEMHPKARLVAQGFSQKPGVDYSATYAPVVQMDIVRFMFALTASCGLELTQFDVKTAFLYGRLDEDIYMRQPHGLDDGTGRVWKLKRSLYGLKQAPRAWNIRFTEALKLTGLMPTTMDGCVFQKSQPFVVLIIYVDDAMIFSRTQESAAEIIQILKRQFEVHIMQTGKFLGLQYYRSGDGCIHLHQSDYIYSILDKFGMMESNPSSTPFEPGQIDNSDEPFLDNELYRELIGNLQYAASQTRLDIAYTIGYLGRKVTRPTLSDWSIAKRCLRYLKGTPNLEVKYSPGHASIIGYSDADFAGDRSTYKSTNGCVVLFAGGPIHWKSKLQRTVVTSTTEAEYLALSAAIKTITFIRDFALSLEKTSEDPIELRCDNQGAVHVASNEGSAQRTRHMGAQLAYARQQHEKGVVKIKHIPADQQLADVLTKPLQPLKFKKNINMLLTIPVLLCCISVIYSNKTGLVRQHISSTIWLPSAHWVEKGLKRYQGVISKHDHCEELRNYKNLTDEQQIQDSIEKSITICEDRRARIYLPKFEQLKKIKIDHARFPRESENDETIGNCAIKHLKHLNGTLPGSNEIGMNSAHYWSTLLVPFYESIWEYTNEGSTRNTVKKQNDHLVGNTAAINCISKQIQKQIVMNSNVHETIKNLTQITKEASGVQAKFLKWYPYITAAVTKAQLWIQREADLLTDVIAAMKEGKFDSKAAYNIAKAYFYIYGEPEVLKNFAEIELRTYKHQFSKLVRFTVVNEDRVSFAYQVPLVNENITVYTARYMKNWIDDTTFTLCEKERFCIYNSDTNCTKLIKRPVAEMVSEQCNERNYNDLTDENCIQHQALDKVLARESKPETIKTPYGSIIQCYHHNITVENITRTCPKTPMLINLETTFSVNGYSHEYVQQSIELNTTNEKVNISAAFNEGDNPWKLSITAIEEAANVAQKDNKLMMEIGKASRIEEAKQLLIKHSDIVSYISIPVLMVSIGCGFIIYIKCRKDPIMHLVETQLLSSVLGRPTMNESSRSATPTPSINIEINTQERREPIYPELRRVHFEECQFIAPVSSSQSICQSVSKDSMDSNRHKENLRQMNDKPCRFIKPQFVSTISLPSPDTAFD